MRRLLADLRQDEDGQALVLAAIVGLVLCLLLATTLQFGRAIYDRTELQNAADSAAYSQAAVEARALNFTAYANRTMVVHYVSAMTATAYLTWIHYAYGGLKLFFDATRWIPEVGAVSQAIDRVMKAAVLALDRGLAVLLPLLNAVNRGLYALTESVWAATALRLRNPGPEASSGAPQGRPFEALWPVLIGEANESVFAQVRGHATLADDVAASQRIFLNDPDPEAQEARLHLIEIANSARSAWVAYGDRGRNPSWSPLGRHSSIPLGCGRLGSVARTELGTLPPGSDTPGGGAQIFSGDRLHFAFDCTVLGVGISGDDSLFEVLALDEDFQNPDSPRMEAWVDTLSGGGLVDKLLNALFGSLGIFGAMQTETERSLPREGRPFVLAPYVAFAPSPLGSPAGGRAGALGNFAQPDVLVGLVRSPKSIDAEPAGRLFSSPLRVQHGQLPEGKVDFTAGGRAAGGGLPNLPPGQVALAAAQAYYHRPGDWKEQPNLFNPLWAARLMPVLEANAAARLGLDQIPGLSSWLLH